MVRTLLRADRAIRETYAQTGENVSRGLSHKAQCPNDEELGREPSQGLREGGEF